MKEIRGKSCCEICGTHESSILDFHHIIPRKSPLSTDNLDNLALICSNDHRRVHSGDIIIEGVYMTTAGAQLIFHYRGEPCKIRPGIIFLDDGLVKIVD